MVLFLLQGKAGDGVAINNDDNNDGAGSPLFTFVDENIFKKETFLGKCAGATKKHCRLTLKKKMDGKLLLPLTTTVRKI